MTREDIVGLVRALAITFALVAISAMGVGYYILTEGGIG